MEFGNFNRMMPEVRRGKGSGIRKAVKKVFGCVLMLGAKGGRKVKGFMSGSILCW